ncbi:MAG: SLC13 family permease [Phycisphaerales bacterium JB039]
MHWQAWTTAAIIGLTLAGLIRGRPGPDIVLAAAVALLVFTGVLAPAEALAGMANEGLATVAILYIVVCGLTETGAVRWIGQSLLGRSSSTLVATVRMMAPVSALSAFTNNTPLVAMLIPAVADWCRRQSISPSKMMIPLSYAAIMGGTCSLIGTSTNLVVNGLWRQTDHPSLGFFEIAWVGLPCAIIGTLYMLLVGRRLLPQRKAVLSFDDDARSYTAEMIVEPGGPLVGRSIEQAGLRGLPGLYLAEIDREDDILPAVGPSVVLHGGDRLVFVGVIDSIVDLKKIRGLEPAPDQIVKLDAPRPQRQLVEAVVSRSNPLIGRSIREGRFRSVYNAVVIAVARGGERIRRKMGDIVLEPGDTLLLEAPTSFADQQRLSRDFYLVSPVADSAPVRHERAMTSLAILLVVIMVAVAQPFGFGVLHAAVLGAGLTLAARCCTGAQARRSVDWQVVIVIAASLALGVAMERSGLAALLGNQLASISVEQPWLALAMVYLATMLLTEMITNNAAAVLMFPLAQAAALKMGVDFKPFVMAIMMAASASFSTPIGYQTNLMVLSPGGYRFADYLRVGLPMNLLLMTVTLILAPIIWPLSATP